jgi:hypothetical protein
MDELENDPQEFDGRSMFRRNATGLQAVLAGFPGDEQPSDAPSSYRPTIGGRLAGVSTPKPSVATGDAPPEVPVASTPVPSMVTDGLESRMPPTPPQSPTLPGLMQERARLGKPTDRNAVDPATGKPKYKMGIGARIAGAFANFGTGFATHGQGDSTYVGPGATNRRYAIDEETRKANLENVGSQIGDQEKLAEENRKLFDSSVKQAYDTQLGAARTETANAATSRAEAYGQLADTKQQLADLKASQGPAEPKTEAEIAVALQNAMLKGDKQKAAVYRGALDELKRQKAAERAPRDTTLQDVTKAIQVAQFRMGELDKVDKSKETERTQRYSEIDKDVKLKYNPTKMAEAKAKVDSDLETKYAPKAQEVHDKADEMLGLTKSGAPLKSNKGATAPAKPANNEQRVRVKEKATGKMGTLPQSQVDKAVQSGKYEKV